MFDVLKGAPVGACSVTCARDGWLTDSCTLARRIPALAVCHAKLHAQSCAANDPAFCCSKQQHPPLDQFSMQYVRHISNQAMMQETGLGQWARGSSPWSHQSGRR